MSSVVLGTQRFCVEPLQPFGSELLLPGDRQVNVQWLLENKLEEVIRFLRRKSVLVFRDTEPFEDSIYSGVQKASIDTSSHCYHVDRRGTAEALVWRVAGPKRSDTQFVRNSDLRKSVVKNSTVLEPILDVETKSPVTKNLKQMLDDIRKKKARFNPVAIHFLLRNLVIDRKLELLSVRDPGLLDALRDFFFRKAARTRLETVAQKRAQEQLCFELLQQFSIAIAETCLPNAHSHSWQDKTDSTVLVYNKVEPNTDWSRNRTTIFHRGVPNPGMPEQDEIQRIIVRDGKLTS